MPLVGGRTTKMKNRYSDISRLNDIRNKDHRRREKVGHLKGKRAKINFSYGVRETGGTLFPFNLSQ